jgi:hypothetical protein
MRNTLLSEYIFTSVTRWKRFPFRVSPQVPECEKVIYGKKIKLGWGGGWGGEANGGLGSIYIFYVLL